MTAVEPASAAAAVGTTAAAAPGSAGAEEEAPTAAQRAPSRPPHAAKRRRRFFPLRRRKLPIPNWLPLESNPDVLNGFLARVGVEEGPQFVDVLGLDDELLKLVPKPVLALCLLFPTEPVQKLRVEALKDFAVSCRGPEETFYLAQHEAFGNACGTIAAVHAVGNLARSGEVRLRPGSPIEKFLQRVAGLSPVEAGLELAGTVALHEASEEAATSHEAQTETPDCDD